MNEIGRARNEHVVFLGESGIGEGKERQPKSTAPIVETAHAGGATDDDANGDSSGPPSQFSLYIAPSRNHNLMRVPLYKPLTEPSATYPRRARDPDPAKGAGEAVARLEKKKVCIR